MLQVFIFLGDDVLPDLALRHQLLLEVQQLVDRVGVGVVLLEALDLGPDGSWTGRAAPNCSQPM